MRYYTPRYAPNELAHEFAEEAKRECDERLMRGKIAGYQLFEAHEELSQILSVAQGWPRRYRTA